MKSSYSFLSLSPQPLPQVIETSNNITDFKDSLRKFDKKELFQSNSSGELEMFGSEKLIQKKKEYSIMENKSLNISIDSIYSSPRNHKNSMRDKVKSFKLTNMIITPIMEVKKLEDLQSPMNNFISQVPILAKKNKTNNDNQFDIMEEGSKLLKEYLTQLKDETNLNKLTKIEEINSNKTIKMEKNDEINKTSSAEKTIENNNRNTFEQKNSYKKVNIEDNNLNKKIKTKTDISKDESDFSKNPGGSKNNMSVSIEFAVVKERKDSDEGEGGIFAINTKKQSKPKN